MKIPHLLAAVLALCSCQSTVDCQNPAPEKAQASSLGAFSVSLAVKDLPASRAFYEALGFEQQGGEPENNWLILRNGTTTVGLFQGMFENNIMTFNPGWDSSAQPLGEFTDVRAIQRRLREAGLVFVAEVDESTSGPGSVVLSDPDGNMILIDQHVE